MFRNFFCKAFVFIWCFNSYGNSVPIDYCLHPLNQSDCGIKPTSVFSYYKPGSRCEIEMWRGCPTFNKFPDEFLCSHHCIFKLLGRADDNQLDVMMMDVEESVPFDECKVPMNGSDCGEKEQFKYTFIDDLCKRVEWKGCQSHNMFDDEETCVNTCNPQTTYNLKNQLDKLPIHEVEVINNILDNVIAESTPRSARIIQLKFIINATEGYTETIIKPETTTEETKSVSAVTTSSPVQTTTQTVKTSTVEETTSKAQETTSKPNETTSKAQETTSKPNETTSKAQETTSKPEETTSKAQETTSKAQETTSEAQGTTSKPEETTSKAQETTSKPEETTSKAQETTSKPNETTSKAQETTSKPNETTSKAQETTSKPEETTSKAQETTSKPEETTQKTVGTIVTVTADTTQAASTSTAITTSTTEGDGSAEEVVLT